MKKLFIIFSISVLIAGIFLSYGCNPTASEKASAVVIGTVYDSTTISHPVIPYAMIVINSKDSIWADANGVFTARNLIGTSNYTFAVYKPGFSSKTVNVQTIVDDTVRIRINLISNNIGIFNNLLASQYFPPSSSSAIDLFYGQIALENWTAKDVQLRDSISGQDTLMFLRSANLDSLVPGYETRFTNAFPLGSPRSYTQSEFDAMTYYPDQPQGNQLDPGAFLTYRIDPINLNFYKHYGFIQFPSYNYSAMTKCYVQ